MKLKLVNNKTSMFEFDSESMQRSLNLKGVNLQSNEARREDYFDLQLSNNLPNNNVYFKCSLNDLIILKNYLNIMIKN